MKTIRRHARAARGALAAVALGFAALPAGATTPDLPVSVSEPGTFSLFAIAMAAAVIVARLRKRK